MSEQNITPCLWHCPNCGQVHFGDDPPDMCAFCRDFTTWQRIDGSTPNQRPHPPDDPDRDTDTSSTRQPPLFDE